MSTKSSSTTIFWWIGWIVLTLVSFFLCSAFWTPWIARHVGPMSRPGAPLIWVALVFGSWLVLLVPLIIVMYQKVDKAYEDARLAREKTTFQKQKALWDVQSVSIPPERRKLPQALRQKISRIPETLKGGHLVSLHLRNGRQIPHAFVLNGRDLLGLYDQAGMDFAVEDILDVKAVDLDGVPAFEEQRWLRLDGVGSGP